MHIPMHMPMHVSIHVSMHVPIHVPMHVSTHVSVSMSTQARLERADMPDTAAMEAAVAVAQTAVRGHVY